MWNYDSKVSKEDLEKLQPTGLDKMVAGKAAASLEADERRNSAKDRQTAAVIEASDKARSEQEAARAATVREQMRDTPRVHHPTREELFGTNKAN